MSEKRETKSNDRCIRAFFICGLCHAECPDGMSLQTFARLEAGFTQFGLQVWCRRHNCNVIHINFEKQEHPFDATRRDFIEEARESE